MPFKPFAVNTQGIRRGSILGRPLITLGESAAGTAEFNNTSGATFGGTNRIRMDIGPTGVTDISVVWQNYWTDQGTTSAGENFANISTITFGAVYIEYGTTTYQVFFNGLPNWTLGPGGTVISDPISLFIPAFTTFYVRQFISLPNGGFIPATTNSYYGVANNYGAMSTSLPNFVNATGTTNLTINTGAVGYPIGCIGSPTGSTDYSVTAVCGDSIYAGHLATAEFQSAPIQALQNNAHPYWACAIGSETGTNFLLEAQTSRRMQLLSQVDTIFCNYGTNDIYLTPPNLTFVQMQAMYINLWTKLTRFGATVIQDTILPRLSAAATPASSQTVASAPFEVIRQQVNAWLRAPKSAGANASAMYDAGGMLAGINDSASWVETDASNDVPLGPTAPSTAGHAYCGLANNVCCLQDGIHPNQATYTLLAGYISLDKVGTFGILPTKYT